MEVEIYFSKTLTYEEQVRNFIFELQNKEDDTLIELLVQAFEDLKNASNSKFPLGEYEPFIVNREKHGNLIQFELIKKLSQPRIFEMRIDYNKEYHRLIYFPYKYNGQNCYVFVYGFTKIPGRPDPTNFYMDKAKQLYDHIKKHNNEKDFF